MSRYRGRGGRDRRQQLPRVAASLCATCLVDQFYPEVGVAAVEVLRRLGVDVDFPDSQTCCGQIAFNGGFRTDAAEIAKSFLDIFEASPHVVVPSGSCTSMIKVYYPELFANDPENLERAKAIGERTHELSEFIVNILGVSEAGGSSEGLVTYHDACHLLRELGVKDEPRTLIQNIAGIELEEMENSDTCCGFGGLFSVKYPHISAAMLEDKLEAIKGSGASTVVANDCGCLMHIRGALERNGIEVRAVHIAQLLAEEGE